MSLRQTLSAIILALDGPRVGDYLARPCPIEGYWVGRDRRGNSILLVPPESVSSSQLMLEHIEYVPRVLVSVEEQGGVRASRECGVVSLVGFSEQQPSLEATVFSAIITEAGHEPKDGQVYSAVQRLADMFSSAAHTDRRTQLGLWGELLVLSWARDIERMSLAWLPSPDSVTDFFSNGEGVEVKTTQSSARIHTFSLGQLNASTTANIWVVSLVAQEDPVGASVNDLLEQILLRLNARPDLQSHVAARVLATYCDAKTVELRFDLKSARESIRIVPFGLVPKITVESEVVSAQWSTTLPISVSRKVLLAEPNSLGLELSPG